MNSHTTFTGVVADVYSDKRITVTMESEGTPGFPTIFTEEFSLRKNGTWVRRGVTTGCGWEIE